MAGRALQCGGGGEGARLVKERTRSEVPEAMFSGWVAVERGPGADGDWAVCCVGPGGGRISRGGGGAEKSLPPALSSCVTQSPPLSSQGPCLPRTVGSHQLPGGC